MDPLEPRAPVAPAQFSVGGALDQAFTVLYKNFASFMVMAMVVFAPLIAYAFWTMKELEAVFASGGLDAVAEAALTYVGVSVAATIVLSKVLASAIVYGVVQQLHGTPATFGACLGHGLRRLPAVLGVTVVWAIAVAAGLALAIVPGLFLLSLLYVALPASVIERTGVFGALQRSAVLTRGNRFALFGLMVAELGIQLGMSTYASSLFGGDEPSRIIVIGLFVSIFVGTFDAVLAGVTYVQLRWDREGVSTDDLARVFE